MKFDLFSVPFWVINIDINKIKLNNLNFEKTWLSETLSSHNFNNKLEKDSEKYLLTQINNLIGQTIKPPYKIILKSIWENQYGENDFQEKHEHAGSHFSFVIYKKIKESNTIFMNPVLNLLESYYEDSILFDFFSKQFKPSCREGQMIIFPSFISHMVLKHSNSVTIAGNIKIEKLNANI